MTTTPPNRAICIIGMHRSGTSMVANILQQSGLNLGPDEQFISALADNPRGFFEYQPIVDLNNELLAHFGGSWYAPPDFPGNWENDPALQSLKRIAQELIHPFQATTIWGWKDPRTALLIPFWRSIIPNLAFVICMRNPLDVAKSLEKRNKMDIGAAGYLWGKYILTAIQDSAGAPRMMTFYEDYFGKNAAAEIEKLQIFCGLQKKSADEYSANLIDQNLLHHQSSIAETIASESLPPEHLALYLALRNLANQHAGDSGIDALESIPGIIERFRRDEPKTAALLRKKIVHTEKMFQDFTIEIIGIHETFKRQQNQLDAKETLISRQNEEIVRRDLQITQQQTEFLDTINRQQAEIAKRGRHLKNQQAEIAKRGRHLKNQQALLAKQRAQLNSMRNHSAGLTDTLAMLQKSLSWRMTAPLRFGFNTLPFLLSPQKWLARSKSLASVYERMANEIRNSSIRDFLSVRWFYLKYHGPLGYVKNAYRELHHFAPSTSAKAAIAAPRPLLPPAQNNNTGPAVIQNGPNGQKSTVLPQKPPFIRRKPIKLEVTPVYHDVVISVVIPVKNAGSEFRFMLSLLKNQEGFREVEMVIVDSGSTDGSVEIAKSYGAKVIEIAPETFSHSYARNLGAENASGEYVLFTVQDAMPPSKTWLYELFRSLKKGEIVASSCAEYPREDADLFYRVMCWNHYRFMEVDREDRIMSQPPNENYVTLRKNAQVSDIANLVERDVFMQYRYRNDYAEDLDLGIRLIKDGYKLALLGSVRIIHSHNRPPYYHLRRGFVEKTIISKLLPDQPNIMRESDVLFKDILFAFQTLDAVVFQEIKKITLPCAPQLLFERVKEKLHEAIQQGYLPANNIHQNEYLDEKFSAFLKNVKNQAALLNGKSGPVKNSILLNTVNGFMGFVYEYMGNIYEQIDDTVLEEFNDCLYKAGAFFCGTYLGASYLRGSKKTKAGIDAFYKELAAGV